MRYLIFLIFSISLISDEGDIVERKIIDTEIYKKNLKSFCRPKLKNNESTWFEDFDNPQLSRNVWNYSISNGFYDGRTYISGWGNGELQYYTKPKKNNKNYTTKNLFIEDGLLKIQPIRKPYKGFKYTSSRINTKGLRDFSFPSEITICFKVPSGIGFWPAFWLMPIEDIRWPQGGEIDILENRGRITNISSSALHFGKKWGDKSTLVGEVLIPSYANFQDTFHSITFRWEQDKLSFFLDDNIEPYFYIDKSHPEFKKYEYPFNRTYYMILNVAVGGKYDNYLTDKNAFCNNKECSNKEFPDKHRFLIDWIEYKEL